jgi:putative transcriptional regulator
MINTLKDLRVARGWTQAELGDLLGVSRQAVIAVEADKHSPSLDLAFKIAVIFETTVEAIFENPHRRDY